MALVRMVPMLSCSSTLLAAGARISGSISSAPRISAAKTRNTDCQDIMFSRYSASGAPITCPALPTAVVTARLIERFSWLEARPTTARITPNPVPAMPKPTSVSESCMASGVMARLDRTKPAA